MKTKKMLGWWALVIAAASVSFIWFAGCPAEGQVEETVDKPVLPKPVSLQSLTLRFSSVSSGSLFQFDGSAGPYMVNSKPEGEQENGETFVLTAVPTTAGDNIEVSVKSDSFAAEGDGSYHLPLLVLTDPTYIAKVTVSRIVKEAGEGIEEEKISKQYSIAINPPQNGESNVPLEDIEEKIAEAEDKIDSLETTIVVGNPALNSVKSAEIVDVITALNTLKQGELVSRTYTKVNDGAEPSEETEMVLVYNLNAINTCLAQLDELVDTFDASDGIIRQPFMTFAYTGAMQLVPIDPENGGVYELEAVGGSGGHQTNTSQTQSALGGKGGHIKARFNLAANQKLTVRVGGQGKGTAVYEDGNYVLITQGYTYAKPGGWPNGGQGGKGSGSGPDFNPAGGSWAPGTGGGGSTDFTLGEFTDADSFETALQYGIPESDPRIIVAAGGGGCMQRSGGGWTVFSGANAGEDGYRISGGSPSTPHPAAGASATQVGVNGRGGSGDAGDGEGSGGGGGGFKGGGANSNAYKKFATGAGGTNHIRAANSGGTFTGVSETYGNGWAKITWISN